MGKVLFFGYGSYRSSEKIKEITGREPKCGNSAILEGYCLATQVLDQIPENPRKILEKVWGKNFQAYTIKQGKGIVSGRVWEIDEEDLAKIKKWEFIENNIDDSWREIHRVSVTTINGETLTVYTEKARDVFMTKEIVDGINYEDNLNARKRIDLQEDDEYKLKEIAKIRRELSEIQFQQTAHV